MRTSGGSEDPIARAQAILDNDLRTLLATLQATHAWTDDACIALAAPGKLLASSAPSMRTPAGFWALLPLTIAAYCHRSSSPTPTWRMRRLALACELLLCALDYFDEFEDEDSSDARRSLGDGRLLNCVTALYQLALQLLAELDATTRGFSPSTDQAPRLSAIASEELLHAMHGQHLDLLAEQRPWLTFDPEECVTIVEAKAGSLCRLVCRLATVSSSASDQLTALFAQVGTHLGIAAQIENDIHDLETSLPEGEARTPDKSDLARGKKTLPLVLAAHLALQNPGTSADSQQQEGKDRVWPVQAYRDAIQASLASAVYHRLSISVLVEQIEHLHGTAISPELRLLLGIDAL